MTRLLITGANRGIGKAIAEAAFVRGLEVIATARRVDSLADVSAHERLELDVTSDESVATAVAAAQRIDVLVNNAGVGVGGPTEAVPIAEAQREFDVNFFGTVRLIRAVLPQMRARRSGTIVNISSLSASVPWPFGAYYAASKAAVNAFSEALRQEVQPLGVHVVVIEPGIIDTSFSERFTLFDGPSDYNRVSAAWAARFEGAHPGPEVVAEALLDGVLDHPGSAMRIRVGDDANELLELRRREDDASFVEQMKQYFHVDLAPSHPEDGSHEFA